MTPGKRSIRDSAAPQVVTLDAFSAARTLLRARDTTTQAGFTAERIPLWLFEHRPILIDDGAQHDEHRRTLARFFAPAKLAQQHADFIEQAARDAVEDARAAGGCAVDELALLYSVTVASRIVGLTHAPVERLAERLTRFFRQPPVDHTAPDHGRTQRDWIRAARMALGPLIGLYLHDVRPAIRARRRQRRTDIISHLLDLGYRPRDVLVECLTYGTAGMVTTREFISLACWRLLEDDRLRQRYLAADRPERHAILAEMIRLEPPVSHLYRRVRAEGGCPYPKGTLVDIDVGAANRDPEVFGDDADALCPTRGLPASEQTGLSFGDGPHRCPGAPLAMLEADALLTALLRADPVMRSAPAVGWETLVQGYQIRGLEVTLPSPADASSAS